VIAAGKEVKRFRVGDRVIGTFFRNWIDGEPTPQKTGHVPGFSVDGMLAEEVTVAEDEAVAMPQCLEFDEAATLPCAALTAWNALFVSGRALPGSTVLLLGTGGVSIWALQLAKAAGLRTILTSSSDAKLERALWLGADEVINYRTTPEWQHDVLQRTGGRGVDLVVEVGGQDTLARSILATRMGGTIAIVGHVGGLTAELSVLALSGGTKSLVGLTVGSRRMLEDLSRFVDATDIRPAIDRVFSFDQACDAYAYLAAAGHVGKVVIRLI
jgi:NADPH:quinone reductase-like Zn-dependent oxidoreductase